MKTCPGEEALRRLLDGVPDTEVPAHVQGCPHCQEVLDRLTDPGRLPARAPAEGLRPEFVARLEALAAAPQTLPAAPQAGRDGGPSVPGYELCEELGRGGMGVVYRARHLRLGRLVALKMVLAGAHAGPSALLRFRIEAEAAAALTHPHIVPVHEVGEADGCPYLALEYVDGGPLARRLQGGPFPPRQAAELVRVLATAVDYAHRRGVVHRDLKPANVLLTADGQPKIADFGLAKRLGTDGGQTATGEVFGTPGYMAPEQAQGRAREVGPATDVWALGAILYELLTGRPPFAGATPLETLLHVTTQEPVPPARLRPGVSRDLETICLKCLRKDPERRYASAEALAEDLRRFLAGEPVQARPVRLWERGLKWVKRKPALASLLAVSALFLVSLLIGGLAYSVDLQSAYDAERRARHDADARRAEAEGHAYLADMHLAHHAWQNGDVEQVRDLLRRHAPRPGQEDLRGFEWYYLARLSHSEQPGPALGLGIFALMALSPDGRTLAGYDGEIPHPGRFRFETPKPAPRKGHFYDLATGKPNGRLPEFPDGVTALAFSADGHTFAAGGAKGEVAVRDLRTGREKVSVAAPGFACQALAFAPGGASLAVVTGDGGVYLWEADRPAPRRLLTRTDPPHHWEPASPGPRPLVAKPSNLPGAFCLAFSPDGKTLAVSFEVTGPALQGQGRGMIFLWDLATSQRRAVFPGHRDAVHCLAFSPDSKTLVTGGGLANEPGELKMWDAQAGLARGELRGVTFRPTALAFSPDGRLLAGGSLDGLVKLWEPARDPQPVATLDGHQDVIGALAFSPDGLAVVAVDRLWAVKRWDLGRALGGASLRGHRYPLRGLAFAAGGQTLVTVASNVTGPGLLNEVFHWNLSRDEPARRLSVLTDEKPLPLTAFALTRDGKRLAAAGSDGKPCWWETDSARPRGVVSEDRTYVGALAFSPDGGRLAGAGTGGLIRLWDLGTREELARFSCACPEVNCLALAPGGRLLAIGCRDRTIKVWDLTSRQQASSLRGPDEAVTALAFGPDGRTLAGCGADKAVWVWDVATGEARAFTGHTRLVLDVAFAPDGQTLASAGEDGTVKLWGVRSGRLQLTLTGPGGALRAVAFAPDGKVLAAAGSDTVRVWRVATEEEAARWKSAGSAKRPTQRYGQSPYNPYLAPSW